MSVLGAAASYAKMVLLWAAGRRVGADDYRSDYDRVAGTYGAWNARMGKSTLLALPEGLEAWAERRAAQGGRLRILDLACGDGFLSEALGRRLAGMPGVEIACVDISPAMASACSSRIEAAFGPRSATGASGSDPARPRFGFVVSEGLAYMASLPEGFLDAVFCGWGMVYFDHRRLVPLLARALGPGGLVGAVMNARGTMAGVEEAVVGAMAGDPRGFRKVMDIRFALPDGRRGFESRFLARGFRSLVGGEGEETATFDSPEALWRWLSETGALAGLESVFEPGSALAAEARKRIEAALGSGGRWSVKHKFTYGVFERKGGPR